MLDGIDLCSNDDTAESNTYLQQRHSRALTCRATACGGPSATNATVKGNTINEACAGILTGTGASGDTTTPNTYFNDFHRDGGQAAPALHQLCLVMAL